MELKNTWRYFLRRLAVHCVASIGVAWSAAMCYAVQLAHDNANDPTYADGWQAGDNGGSGFTAWNFDSRLCWQGTCYSQYANPGFKAIDDGLKLGTQFSNPFNGIGRAWVIGTTPDSDGVARAGRGFPALQPNQTLSIVVDNPAERQFGKGYFIRLNGGTGGVGGNICYQNGPCSPDAMPVNKLTLWRYEYLDYGIWKLGDFAGDIDTSNPELRDTDTAAAGMQFDITMTGADTYDLSVTPLANPANKYTHSGSLRNPGEPLDWIEFTFFNVVTDTGTPPTTATDFYIRSMEITGPAPPGVPGDYNNNGAVDAADYVVFRDRVGTSFSLPNELPGVTPGQVTQEDYDAWRARFGTVSQPGSLIANTPEPATFVFVVAAAIGLAGLRKPTR
jgi:hypothetical protein